MYIRELLLCRSFTGKCIRQVPYSSSISVHSELRLHIMIVKSYVTILHSKRKVHCCRTFRKQVSAQLPHITDHDNQGKKFNDRLLSVRDLLDPKTVIFNFSIISRHNSQIRCHIADVMAIINLCATLSAKEEFINYRQFLI